MKMIHVLQPFVSERRVSISGPDLALSPPDKRDARNLVIRREESKFAKDEEIQVQYLTVDGERNLIVVDTSDDRSGAILEGEHAGKDFEVYEVGG